MNNQADQKKNYDVATEELTFVAEVSFWPNALFSVTRIKG